MWILGLVGLGIFLLGKFIYNVKPEHIIYVQYAWLAYTMALVGITSWWTWHIKSQIECLKSDKPINDFPICLNVFKQIDNSLRYVSMLIEVQELDRWQQKARQAEENLKLVKSNSTDPLTGIANRSYLDKHLAQILGKVTPLSLVMLDIDHFKKVNDTYGHQVGDEVLQHFARTVQKTLRPNDFLARYGGEEFTFICQASLEYTYLIAERVRQAVESTPAQTSTTAVRITTSLGVAEYRPDDTPKSLRKRADDALYKAKIIGRNLVLKEERVNES